MAGQPTGLRKVHLAEAVLLGPVSLGIPAMGVVAEILGHGFIGVKRDLAKPGLPRCKRTSQRQRQ